MHTRILDYHCSCGRLHSCSLDIKGKIWNFVNWGRPFQLSSHLLSQPDSQPIQIECGWSFSSALLKNGEVLVWWPTVGVLGEEVDTQFRSMDELGIGEAKQRDGVIPCHTWTVAVDPVLLPSLPSLPDIAGLGENFRENPPRLIEIGGMDSIIIGLTNYGHVLRFRGLDHERAIGTLGWQYVCPRIGLSTSLIFVVASRIQRDNSNSPTVRVFKRKTETARNYKDHSCQHSSLR
jgi:SCF-associated factor 1